MKPKPNQPVYITTTLPYVNADPHIGFAMEIVRADALARFYELMGHEVFFNTGTDEHGQKIHDGAIKENLDTKSYTDKYAARFRGLKELLGLKDNIHFIRTTDPHHEEAAKHIWQLCKDNGYIYKKTYQAKYCVGCEMERTDSELVDGKCPLHPNRELSLIDEENYFFRFSALEDKLLEHYKNNQEFVKPDWRQKEIQIFVENGLEDFSISRLKAKMPWGVAVPDDDDHVMYVWFDALTNYISTLGWPSDKDGNYKNFWEDGFTIQIAGKDNLRQQSAMWQAMLIAAGLTNTDQIIIEGFVMGAGGIKMSKSLGNVINPYNIVEKYGTDALRYYLLRHLHMFDDSPVTLESFHELYNAHLVNGIGNLTNRITKLSETHLEKAIELEDVTLDEEFTDLVHDFELQKASDHIFTKLANIDESITHNQPFKVIKTDPETGKKMITDLVKDLFNLAKHLEPFLPETSQKIIASIKENKKPTNPLFPRIES